MQFDLLKRRSFMTLLGGAAAAWPLAARAQQPAVPVIGFLRSTSAAGSAHLVTAFRQGLSEAGLVEGRTVSIDYRWADNALDRLPGLLTDLIRRQAAVIVGNTFVALAVQAASMSVPFVFLSGSDPVRGGLVASLNRPGGNFAGVVFTTVDLGAKRLGLLHELVPKAAVIAVLLDPNAPEVERQVKDLQEAGRVIGRQMLIVNAADDREFAAGFVSIVEARVGALLLGGGPLYLSQRRQLAALALRHGLPSSFVTRDGPEVGGLMSYGSSQTDAYRRAGSYVAQILKGAKPGDLPVQLADKFELVINLATAKALGLDVPATLLARADEVIE
jgi:ABC-type uncharacterized transport system substrate-binding protein